MYVELDNSVEINKENEEEKEEKEEKENKETDEISTSINLVNLSNNKIKNNSGKEECVSKYNNYILQRKKELTLDLLLFIGYDTFDDTKYITFH